MEKQHERRYSIFAKGNPFFTLLNLVQHRAHNGRLAQERYSHGEERAKEVEEAERLDDHADDRVPQHHEHDAAQEAHDAAPALLACEETDRARQADREREPAEEEHVAEREQRRVEEQQHAEHEEHEPDAQQQRADLAVVVQHLETSGLGGSEQQQQQGNCGSFRPR